MSFQKIYETDRLYVRPLTEQDVLSEYYQKWFYDKDVTAQNSHGLFPYTESQMNEFIERIKAGNDIIWAVIAKDGKIGNATDIEPLSPYSCICGIHIGNISLQRIDYIYRSAEFAVVIGEKEYWGKGYTTEAAELLFNHGFNRLNLHRIWTGTASTNIGMQKVAEKLGMNKEGVWKEAMYLNGQYVDIFEYGILKRDWNNFKLKEDYEKKQKIKKEVKTQKKNYTLIEEIFTEYEDEMFTKTDKLKNELQNPDDQKLVDQIAKARSRNNENWMQIIRVGLNKSPDEIKEILYNINQTDKEISKLVEDLTKRNG